MTLSTRVLLGLGLGILTGLFFGEGVAFLKDAGRLFVLLMQMTVLPYMTVALVGSLGRLSPAEASTLARHAGTWLLVLWGIALAVVVSMPLAYPEWEAASFFSTNLVAESGSADMLSLYIPSNPFHSLSAGIVPAVVVFSVAVGLALMGVENKSALLESLSTLEQALMNVTGFVVGLAPYGVFAITANAAGTMDSDDFLGLQVYVAVFAGMALILALWALPGLVAAVTPVRHRELLGRTRDALVTAFATGSVFVVLPILTERSREILDEHGPKARESSQLVAVIVPIGFTLASAGKLLSLGFPLFAGWVSGFPIPVSDYPRFLVSGVFSFFASTVAAVPMLLDMFRIPADTFQLFLIADNVVGNRFGSMLAAVHIVALSLLGACGGAGLLVVRRRAVLRWGFVTLALVGGVLLGTRVAFQSIDRPYGGYGLFVDRPLLFDAAKARALEGTDGVVRPGPTLRRIRESGVVRIGYGRDRLPYAFRNQAGNLVGLDVEMGQRLALDLGVDAEFTLIDMARAPELLDRGEIDVMMSGIAIQPELLERMSFSAPYQEETIAFIVLDHRRNDFASRKSLKSIESLRLGVPGAASYYVDKVRHYLPQAEVVPLDSPRDFFTAKESGFDAFVYGAEAGSAWTLIYPQFTVAVPHPDILKVPVGYAVARGDLEMANFLSQWIQLKKRDRTLARLFDYWVSGIKHEGAEPRWSVWHNVLGFGAQAAP